MGKGLEERTTWQVEVNELGLISRAVGTSHNLSQGRGRGGGEGSNPHTACTL